jgi:hypothetical protein
VLRSKFLADQLPFPLSLSLEAQMEFTRNMFNSRSGEPDDRFESMVLELELDDFEQSKLDQYTDIETSAKVGSKPTAKHRK